MSLKNGRYGIKMANVSKTSISISVFYKSTRLQCDMHLSSLSVKQSMKLIIISKTNINLYFLWNYTYFYVFDKSTRLPTIRYATVSKFLAKKLMPFSKSYVLFLVFV